MAEALKMFVCQENWNVFNVVVGQIQCRLREVEAAREEYLRRLNRP